ncbi:MAG: tetratricopeptide repeat protein, partial [Candidatus Latescibacteria bacterium]|nr:tetratricopeptide repeat protein [Candidatus Latescibacterota bacterium]
IDPEKLEVLAMAGQMYLMGENYQRAAEIMEKVLEQQADNTAVIFNLAAAYKGLDEFGKATALFQKSVEADSTDTDAWYQLGLLHDRQEELDAAIGAFQKVVDLKPSNAQAWRALSRSYARKSQAVKPGTADAKKCAKKAEEAFLMAESLQGDGTE